MSVLLIILLAFLISLLVGAIGGLILAIADNFDRWCMALVLIVAAVVFIAGIFIGIGINNDEETLFVANYEAQKTTIEQSLRSDYLTGFERLELVKQASELNGELAKKKEKYKLWHYVLYDKDLFDNIEPIDFITEEVGDE